MFAVGWFVQIDKATLQEILRLAEKATPGPWDNALDIVPEGTALRATLRPSESLLSVDRDGMGVVALKDDAAFIGACDPTTILAIVRELMERRAADIPPCECGHPWHVHKLTGGRYGCLDCECPLSLVVIKSTPSFNGKGFKI